MDDTIAAIATGAGDAAIGIVRVSGPSAIEITDRIYTGRRSLVQAPSHCIMHGYIEYRGREIDEVMVAVYRSPHSYTGEDSTEINCHGGQLVLREVLDAVTAAGARPAEPGEFTKRAFLHGKLDLSQAEAVMDVISASGDAFLQSSLRSLGGSLCGRVRPIRESLLYEAAYIEQGLDDPDPAAVPDDYPKRLRSKLEGVLADLSVLLDTADDGIQLREGVTVAIVGKPNVGKSSIFNAIAGSDRAIVTGNPGTTRDTLCETVSYGGARYNIIDTAGIRETDDEAESIGVERSLSAVAQADRVLFIVDAQAPLDDNDLRIRAAIESAGRPYVTVGNKCDLGRAAAADIYCSALTGEGIDLLRQQSGSTRQSEAVVNSVRHKRCLEACEEAVRRVIESIDDGMPVDLYTADLTAGAMSLGEITGETASDSLIDEIFSHFCIGK